jgi:hypothetical protein
MPEERASGEVLGFRDLEPVAILRTADRKQNLAGQQFVLDVGPAACSEPQCNINSVLPDLDPPCGSTMPFAIFFAASPGTRTMPGTWPAC